MRVQCQRRRGLLSSPIISCYFQSMLVFLIACLVSVHSLAQDNVIKRNIVGLSFGRLAFGTGDFFGYGVNVEYARRLSVEKPFLKHLSAAIELSFDQGNEQPKVVNPSPEDFNQQFFYSTANIVFTSKITYYPFSKTFAKGLNLSGGLSVGYTNQNFERQASYDSVGQISMRRSYLGYINQVIFGYRVIAGYEYALSKHVLLGVRMDFDNYSGDINTLLAGKIGYTF